MPESKGLMQIWGRDGQAAVFNPEAPTPDMIDIESIAHALSNQCRFGGHVRKFFSVAQHCCIVASYIQHTTGDADATMWGLLHDASEAYIVDIPRPLKNCDDFKHYYVFEKKVMDAVIARFDLDPTPPSIVWEADELGLAIEAKYNLQPVVKEIWHALPEVPPYIDGINCLPPAEAKEWFLWLYEQTEKNRIRL